MEIEKEKFIVLFFWIWIFLKVELVIDWIEKWENVGIEDLESEEEDLLSEEDKNVDDEDDMSVFNICLIIVIKLFLFCDKIMFLYFIRVGLWSLWDVYIFLV